MFSQNNNKKLIIFYEGNIICWPHSIEQSNVVVIANNKSTVVGVVGVCKGNLLHVFDVCRSF